jgi:hypothetical protein
MYTFNEIKESVIKLAENIKSFNVQYFPRKHVYRIKLRNAGHITSGVECVDFLKFQWETMHLQKINWDYLHIDIFDKHIEIRSLYKFI